MEDKTLEEVEFEKYQVKFAEGRYRKGREYLMPGTQINFTFSGSMMKDSTTGNIYDNGGTIISDGKNHTEPILYDAKLDKWAIPYVWKGVFVIEKYQNNSGLPGNAILMSKIKIKRLTRYIWLGKFFWEYAFSSVSFRPETTMQGDNPEDVIKKIANFLEVDINPEDYEIIEKPAKVKKA